jgi:hypothetical protein
MRRSSVVPKSPPVSSRKREGIMAERPATRASRGYRTICLPIKEVAYLQIINDACDLGGNRGTAPPGFYHVGKGHSSARSRYNCRQGFSSASGRTGSGKKGDRHPARPASEGGNPRARGPGARPLFPPPCARQPVTALDAKAEIKAGSPLACLTVPIPDRMTLGASVWRPSTIHLLKRTWKKSAV